MELHLVEGEKCAERLNSLGLLVTTSCMGSGNAGKTDWTPVREWLEAGGTVVAWKDLDAPDRKTGKRAGEKYVELIAEQLGTAAYSGRFVVVDIAAALAEHGIVLDAAELKAYLEWKPTPEQIKAKEKGPKPPKSKDVWDLCHYLEGEGKDDAAILATLEHGWKRHGRAMQAPAPLGYPGQPPALPFTFGRFDDDSKRPHIRNFQFIKTIEKGKDANGNETEKEVFKCAAMTPVKIVDQISKITNGSLCRVRAPGAREPLLFMEIERDKQAAAPVVDFPRRDPELEGVSLSGGAYEGRIRMLQNATHFKAFLHQAGKLQFNDKRDYENTCYSTAVDVFHTMGEASGVKEYEAIQMRPHEPPMPGHYYAYHLPTDYKPTGKYFEGLLRFFTSNCIEPKDMALLAAAFLTPGWGGTTDIRYGCRPLMVVTASDQGSGKSTIAQIIGDLWGGWMPVHPGEKNEDQFFERALSPGGLTIRLVLLDNITGVLKSGLLDSLITEKIIRGKRMYQGEASRPHDFTWIATLNNARLSRDMADRSFIIELRKPPLEERRANWAKDVASYVARYAPLIIADTLSILRQPIKGVTEGNTSSSSSSSGMGLSDRWAVWAEEVLVRACQCDALRSVVAEKFGAQAVVDVTGIPGAIKVLKLNQAVRDQCDVEIEKSNDFWGGLIEILVKKKQDDGSFVARGQGTSTYYFIPTKTLVEYAKELEGRKELNSGWIKNFIMGHQKAGRMKDIWYQPDGIARGYRVSAAVVDAAVKNFNREIGNVSQTEMFSR